MINKQIERVERPSPERFYRAFVLADKPVIITGAMEEWKARSLWTIDYLKERLGRKQVTVLVSPDGVFNGDPVKGYSEKRKHMGFDDYLDLILQTSNGKEKYYLQQNPMSNFPELAEDIESPDHFKKENLIVSSLWFGPGGSVSPLHFDLSNNLLAQVKGRK